MIKSRRMRLARHVAQMETRTLYRVLVGETEGKGRIKSYRQVDNIKTDLSGIA
jgi:hypothetical protein